MAGTATSCGGHVALGVLQPLWWRNKDGIAYLIIDRSYTESKKQDLRPSVSRDLCSRLCLSADDAARPLAFDFRAVVKVLDGWRDLLRGESKSVVAESSKKSRYHHG